MEKWTPKAAAAAEDMWAAGDSASIIAKTIGTTRNAVLGKAWREGWPAKKKTIWTPEVTETAKRMWTAGDSATTIARKLGIIRSTVLGKVWRERWRHIEERHEQ